MPTEPEDPRAKLLVELPAGDSLTIRDVLAHQQAALVALGVTAEAAQTYLAREHYFRTWERAQACGDTVVDRRFEAAADALARGDLTAVQRMLAEDPALARARSPYGHRQTLLQHIAGSNGIEWARQWQTPPNAVDMVRTLLAAGAEPDAACDSYAPTDTAMTLLCSSCHPADAGLQDALVDALIAGGAQPDGPTTNSDPLWTAITWGYNRAVDALVRGGARIDNLVLAAAAGDLERVRHYLAAPRTPVAMGALPHVLVADHLVEYALIYAAGLDRREVVVELLALSPNLRIVEPLFNASALGAASHPHPSAGRPDGNPAIIALLSAR